MPVGALQKHNMFRRGKLQLFWLYGFVDYGMDRLALGKPNRVSNLDYTKALCTEHAF